MMIVYFINGILLEYPISLSSLQLKGDCTPFSSLFCLWCHFIILPVKKVRIESEYLNDVV